jgi:Ca2+/Na+ antiporter
MSRFNKPNENENVNENENNLDIQNKSLKEKYLELTILSFPVHEIIRMMLLVIACQNMGSITSQKYINIQEYVNNNLFLQILMIFMFIYINTNYKFEISAIATISLVIIYVFLKYINKSSKS